MPKGGATFDSAICHFIQRFVDKKHHQHPFLITFLIIIHIITSPSSPSSTLPRTRSRWPCGQSGTPPTFCGSCSSPAGWSCCPLASKILLYNITEGRDGLLGIPKKDYIINLQPLMVLALHQRFYLLQSLPLKTLEPIKTAATAPLHQDSAVAVKHLKAKSAKIYNTSSNISPSPKI